MINGQNLLKDLKPMLRRLENDIRERCDEIKAVNAGLKAEYEKAREGERTAQTWTAWRDDRITQASAAWILGCVFIRFMEDNDLIEDNYLSGRGEGLQKARDNHTLYFKKNPVETDREYILHVFREAAGLPAVKELFHETRNPVWRLGPTGDGAAMLLDFFQKIDPAEGGLLHDFRDDERDTRFLGDLYQDLSETARKKYALLQTPEFVEEFILDRTLTPAIDAFGLREVRLIDPACGSGHFLLGAFHRLLDLWRRREPGTNERELVSRSLKAVHGVDLNPFATAIARFRLLAAALKASDLQKLKDAPAFTINLATGDALLHGRRAPGEGIVTRKLPGMDDTEHVYDTEDREELKRILEQHYHAVVGNPPYITVKDKAISKIYKERFKSCYRLYSLVCPFLERFFDLAIHGKKDALPGYVGAIVSNSFMKREFGRKLIENYIPKWDLTHIIDTSGAYIPGHGTPTLIFFGRNKKPLSNPIRTVMGIKGEPGTPAQPNLGKVWSSIIELIDQPGSENDFISVLNNPRKRFGVHPWSLAGGGATALIEQLKGSCETKLSSIATSIGFACITKQNEVFLNKKRVLQRNNLESIQVKHFGIGEDIRDWQEKDNLYAIFPYNENVVALQASFFPRCINYMWPYRTNLFERKVFGGKTYKEAGKCWYEYGQIPVERYKIKKSIVYAFVSTHNNFIFNSGEKIFSQTAPVIKLRSESTVNDHIELVGLLNSSAALFWGRQTFFPRGGFSSGKWQERLEWDGTKLLEFPIPEKNPFGLAKELNNQAKQFAICVPTSIFQNSTPSLNTVVDAKSRFEDIREKMIAFQEELDWQCYNFYKLTDRDLWMPDPDDVPRVKLGERAFEIVMGRKMAAGELETTWFERHGSTPITEIPGYWPEAYRELVQRRIDMIETEKNIRLIEQPEYKRRWAMEPWDKQVKEALKLWLLNRLEYALSGRDLMTEKEPEPATREPALISCAKLADELRGDSDFLRVAELYKGAAGFDVVRLVEELVENEAVPFLPALRYKPSGLRKRREWERTWELQRQEDEIDARTKLDKDDENRLKLVEAARLKKERIGDIPVPPKYKAGDFAKTTYWKLRGKLDVPRERFISYPGCNREADTTLVITWAGWDHLQQAKALAAHFEEGKNSGWSRERLLPMLAGLQDLTPWLMQWHNEFDPAFGVGMGDFFTTYTESETRLLGKSMEELGNDY